MYNEEAIDGVVGNAMGPGPGAQAIGAGAEELWAYYAERRFMGKYYEAKAQGPIQWVVDANGEPVLDGAGHQIWVPAPNPMVVATQDALEWQWKLNNIRNIIGGFIAIPMFLLALYWTFTG